ncbi:tape measure protein [Nesterenkonia lacusekhoensis]|uniref:Tape measure domain-containing protein n=1 Tax=Nesterenkonia lacusekhoensis TaxID=150832 RepID=A0ABS4T518_9MICC|nr:tape measure protein [Nesterenkonia lacusekhoensis]MBP2319557.1 tape measure domain-containing protein [Nesterenkonia lacusekhoensis]
MARDVRVRLSAEIQAYLSAMQQAEQAATRVADAADRLGDISISADTSVASDLDQAASSADSAASSMENASGSAESMAGGMDSASAAAQDASAGIESAGASAETASAGLSSVGAQSQAATADMLAASAGAQQFEGTLATVGAQSQTAAGAMQDASAAMQAHGSIAQQASAGIDGLSSSFASGMSYSTGFSGALTSLGQGFANAQQHGAELLGTAEANASAFHQMGGAMAIAGGGLSALMGNVIQTGIEYNTLQQVAGRALETMAGSAEAAAAQMEQLHAFADESPFARDTWITAQQQLMAFGMEAERVVPTLEGVQNAVAAIGGGDAEIMQLVDILGQVEGQGRITGRELQRLGQMGINAADLIGDAMGVSGNQIREQITAGALDAETAIDALTTGMMNQFDGAAEGLRDTMEGSLDRIRARIRDIGSIIATPLVSPDGGGFLVEAINQAADFGSALLELPDPLLQVAGLGAAAAGGITVFGGALVAALPHLRTMASNAGTAWTALANFATGGAGIAGGLRRIGIAAGIAAVALGGMAVVNHLEENLREGAISSGELENGLRRAADAGKVMNDQFAHLDGSDHLLGTLVRSREGVDDMVGAFDELSGATLEVGDRTGFVQDKLYGLTSDIPLVGDAVRFFASDMADAEDAIAQTDDALANMAASGSIDTAVEAMSNYADELHAAGYSSDEIVNKFPELESALYDYAGSLGVSVDETEMLRWMLQGIVPDAVGAAEASNDLADGMESVAGITSEVEGGLSTTGALMGELAEQADIAASALGEIVDAYTRLGIIQLDASEALMSYNEALWDLDDAIEDNGNTMDRSTQAGIDNHRAFRALGEESWALAEANLAAGDSAESVADGLQSTYDHLVTTAEQMGYSEEQAHDYAAAFMQIPEEHRTDVEAYFEDFASDGVDALNIKLENIPEMKQVRIDVDGSGATETVELTQAQIDEIQDKTVGVYATDEGTVLEVQGAIDGVTDGDAMVLVDDEGTVQEVQAEILGVSNGQATVAVDDGNTVNIVQWDIDNIRDGSATVTASANTYGAETDLNHTARNRTTTITATFGGLVNQGGFGSGAGSPFINRAHGGRAGVGTGLAAYASGGRLPSTGLGTDQILGLNRAGQPTAWVDDREWIINRRSSDKYDGLLQAVNQDDPYGIRRYAAQLSGYAAGGRNGYQGQVREFAQPSAPRPAVDTRALAAAMQGQGGTHNQVTIHAINNPRGVPTEQSVKDALEYPAALGGGSFG